MENRAVQEPSRRIPVIDEVDVCVLGGSCTGLFAAVRAAELGARVALVERMGGFGGVATISLVNIWHKPYDALDEKQIFAGLTMSTMERLKKRNAVKITERNPHVHWTFNPGELMMELDEIVTETPRIRPYLHTHFSAPYVGGDGRLQGVFVESKSGRGAILAKSFVDATGDGDLCARLGLETYRANQIQPSTTCISVEGNSRLKEVDVTALVREHAGEFGVPEGYVWSSGFPGSDIMMLAGTRVRGLDCSNGSDFTRAEIEGRRQARALQDLLRKYAPETNLILAGLPARIGIRESRHVRCGYQLTRDDVLLGKRFDDAVANGSYPVDIHHTDKPGTTLMFLDGTQRYCRDGAPIEISRWRSESEPGAAFYQIPLRSMLPQGAHNNVIVAGRMIDADMAAHGAIRVMVNMNQTGEAAGVTAALAVDRYTGSVHAVPATQVREQLTSMGAIII